MTATDNLKPLTAGDIAQARQSIKILQRMADSGQITAKSLEQQIKILDGTLSRAEAEHQQRKSAARFEALYTVSRALGSSLELQTVLDQVMDAIIQLTGAERGFLMLRDDDGGLSVKAARNLDQQTLSSDKFKFSNTIVNQVLDQGQAILTTNAAEDPRFSSTQSIIAQALRSIMATPLWARGNVIGVAYVDSRATAGLFVEDDLAALEALSGQAAITLDNARLFSETDEALEHRIDELRQLRRIDLQLTETLDPDQAILYTLEWACRLSGATIGHLGLVEGDPPIIAAVQSVGLPEGSTLPDDLAESYPQAREVIKNGQSKTLPATGEDTGSTLIVPIRREQAIIGVVILRSEKPDPFTDEQQDLVERVVARAAVAIENAQLYAAVQAADQAKSEFVGIVAHDLKSPMTSISGYVDLTLLDAEALSDQQQEFLRRIKDTIERMEVLVSDLADISRLESGHFFMEETRVAVSEIVQAVIDSTQPEIEARQHTFVQNVEPDLPDMWVDYYRLLQVLTNLVSNAYKYTPNGGTITFSVGRADDRIQFTVADTGVGLSDENLKNLGSKFWRAEDAFTRSQPGTGLGFAITRSLVEQMGSRMEIASDVGQGSSFGFSVAIAPD